MKRNKKRICYEFFIGYGDCIPLYSTHPWLLRDDNKNISYEKIHLISLYPCVVHCVIHKDDKNKYKIVARAKENVKTYEVKDFSIFFLQEKLSLYVKG